MAPTFSTPVMKSTALDFLFDLFKSFDCRVPRKIVLQHLLCGKNLDCFRGNNSPEGTAGNLCMACGTSCSFDDKLLYESEDADNPVEAEGKCFSSDEEKIRTFCRVLKIKYSGEIQALIKKNKREKRMNYVVTFCPPCEMKLASLVALKQLARFIQSENANLQELFKEQCFRAEEEVEASGIYARSKLVCSVRREINLEKRKKEQAKKGKKENGKSKANNSVVTNREAEKNGNKRKLMNPSAITNEMTNAAGRIFGKQKPEAELVNGAARNEKKCIDYTLTTTSKQPLNSRTGGSDGKTKEAFPVERPSTSGGVGMKRGSLELQVKSPECAKRCRNVKQQQVQKMHGSSWVKQEQVDVDTEQEFEREVIVKRRRPSVKKIPCPFCNKILSEWNLPCHVRNRHHDLMYAHTCRICQARFDSASTLESHVLTCPKTQIKGD